jgi:hypothetical protein
MRHLPGTRHRNLAYMNAGNGLSLPGISGRCRWDQPVWRTLPTVKRLMFQGGIAGHLGVVFSRRAQQPCQAGIAVAMRPMPARVG